MKYYAIEPEVAGGLGPNAILQNADASPPQIKRFHYEFDGWLGDPLLETGGLFIVTESLKKKIEALRLTGIAFANVEVSKSGEFEDFYPSRELPPFLWLQVIGQAGQDDFGFSKTLSLVVSQRALDVLEEAGMNHADIADYS